MLLLITGVLFAGGQKEEEAAETAEEKEVTVSFWHFPQVQGVEGYEAQSKEYGDMWAYLAEEFTKKDNNIKVETEVIPWTGGFERFNIAIAGGTPPSIGFDYLGRSGQYYAMDAVVPADDIMPASYINDIKDSIKDLYMVGGKVHALPGFAWNAGQWIVNRGLLEKHGWPENEQILNGQGQPYTFDEWVAFLEKAKATVPEGIWPTAWSCGDEQGDYSWWGIFWGYGGKLFDENGNVYDDPSGMMEGYKLMLELRDKGLTAKGIAQMKGNMANELMSDGKVVMRPGSLGHARNIKKGIDEGTLDFEYNIEVFPSPTEKGDSSFNAVGPTGFIFFAQDKAEQDASSKWVQYAMDDKWWPKMVAATGQFPCQKSLDDANLYAGNDFMEIVDSMLARFPAGDFGLANPQYQKIRMAMAQAGQKIFSGAASVEEAVKEYYAEVRRLVK